LLDDTVKLSRSLVDGPCTAVASPMPDDQLVTGSGHRLSGMNPVDILVTDHVAIVTGGGAGIGGGIAVGLATFGADVVIADIDPDRGEVTARQVEAAGRRALVLPTDMSSTEQIRAMVQGAFDQFGRIDVLVNNAGGVRQGRFLDQSERSWRRHVDLNLFSLFATTAAAVPFMIEGERGGSIVNVASIEALRAAPGFAVYAACKAAMTNFTRTMALELAEHGIRMNALAPDLIATPGLRGLISGPVPDPLPPAPNEEVERRRRYIPLGAEGLPEDCASVAVFLSSKMGRYVTGTTISVDGGTWAASGWTRGDDGWQLYPGQAAFGRSRD
jgi:NAD(P)-dependent dehydrogenase (short-subunit alcohol dehydrogenase family)